MLDLQWLGRPRPIYPHSCIDAKIKRIFTEYVFPGGKFAQLPFLGWETEIVFRYHFSQGIELSKIKLQEIYESNNNLFHGILVFKNWLFIPMYGFKNGITQCVGLVNNKSLLADLMMIILNWNKTDDGFSTLICVQTSI